MTYLAHVVARAGGRGATNGLRGRPLRWIGAPELGIWATEWSGGRELTRADAFAHHDLVAALCEDGPCLPVRFGTWLADAEAARRTIVAAGDRFAAALDRVGDRLEVAVTLLWPAAGETQAAKAAVSDGTPLTAGQGRAFLEARRSAHAVADERRRRADGFAQRLTVELGLEQADVRHETCPSDEVALSLSLLARRGEADALKARATSAVAALAGVRGVVSGPWPPYSFTEDLGDR